MQGLSAEGANGLARSDRNVVIALKACDPSFAIQFVADKRVPGAGHVDPNLVRAAGFEGALNKTGHRLPCDLAAALAVGLETFVVRDGLARIGPVEVEVQLSLETVAAGAGDGNIDGARCGARIGVDQRQIASFYIVHGEITAKAPVRIIVLGHDHDAGCVFVEAVDDAWPRHAANTGEAVAAMVEKRVDQGAAPIASGGMHHETGGFVQDNDVLILKQDVEGDVLGLGIGVFDGRRDELEHLPLSHLVRGVGDRGASDGQGAFFDQRFDLGARVAGAFG